MDAPHVFFLVPTGPGVGLTSVSLGLLRALDREGLRVRFFKPVAQPAPVRQPADPKAASVGAGPERSTHFVRSLTILEPPEPIPFREVELRMAADDLSGLLETVVASFQELATGAEVVLVEGLAATAAHPGLDTLNVELARALDAEVLLVGAMGRSDAQDFGDRLAGAARPYRLAARTVLGAIVNRLNEPTAEVVGGTRAQLLPLEQSYDAEQLRQAVPPFRSGALPLIGAVDWQPSLAAPRVVDVARHLGARAMHEGEMQTRRVEEVAMVARTLGNMTHRLKPGTLIVTPGDREDVLVAACMAALNGVPLAGVVLTGGIEPAAPVLQLCERALQTGLPLLIVDSDSYLTSARAAAIDQEVAIDDLGRMSAVMDAVAAQLDVAYLRERVATDREPRLSPAAFMHRLVEGARAADRLIVLPEGEEPRTIRAAAICQTRGIARCLLLGDPREVHRVAEAQGFELPAGLQIVQPDQQMRGRYLDQMVELRRHKGMTEPVAMAQLQEPVVLATMMLAAGEVDGLVAGALNTTAATVRPALQLIKTRADAKLISSVFFMCLPDQVLVFGDCAINPDPDAEELADIALQSAASAEAFGIAPRVAMLSFSTGASGAGSDVDKVRQATDIARTRRPDLIIDGPLQYDAATVPSVAAQKAPGSPVAGRATVLVFPDLNTGNTTYKAVQRSAQVVAVGPMLQGLRRPVNDLSRGASVDDIVYTIALTAIQAAP